MDIEVKNLTKTYKVKKRSNVDEVARNFGNRKYSLMTAVNNISFTIPSGDIVGFIGIPRLCRCRPQTWGW